MLQLIFIMLSSQICPDLFDVKKHAVVYLLFGANIWNCTWGNETWYRCPWRNICFKTWIGLVSNIQTVCAWINHAVLCYSCMSLKYYREISHGWIFCFLSLATRFSIACSWFSICTGSQESRTTDCPLPYPQITNRRPTVGRQIVTTVEKPVGR